MYTIFALEDFLAQKGRLKYKKISMVSSGTGEQQEIGDFGYKYDLL